MRARSPPRSPPPRPRKRQASGLADILIAEVSGRLGQLLASLEGSPHIEELFSEHLVHGRDLYQKYAVLYAEALVATIERVCRKQRLIPRDGMTAPELARCVEMAVNGAKSMHPAMQPARRVPGRSRHPAAHAGRRRRRTTSKPRPAKPTPAKKSVRRKSGDRK